MNNKQHNSTIGDTINWFKTMTTNEYIKMVKAGILPPFDRRVWQRGYWDRIIRSERELEKFSEYIRNNPLNWETDRLNEGADDFENEGGFAERMYRVRSEKRSGDRKG